MFDDVDLNDIASIKRFVKGTNRKIKNPDMIRLDDGEQWELVDGIQFGQVRTVFDDFDPVLKIGIDKTPALGMAPEGEIYRVLVRRFDDGSVKQIIIDFNRTLDWQEEQDGESIGTPSPDPLPFI